ncbi:MAG: protein-disulfide reductase DsbD domain-containing protein [Pseudohongiellaceae bacterium]
MPVSVFKPLICIGLLVLSLNSVAQVHKTDQIEVELIAETSNVVPGETLWLAIRLDPIDHWHTYWKFGGDSGVATEASEWQLPVGAEAGDIVWPIPEWTPFLGSELVTFTYEREVLLPIPVTVPADFSGSTFELSTKIDWQVCEEICIPGDAQFSLSLPVGSEPSIDDKWVADFAETRALTPKAFNEHRVAARFNALGGNVNVMFENDENLFDNADEAWFFPTQRRLMKYAPMRDVMLDGNRIQISTEQHRRFPQDIQQIEGLLSIVDEEGNWTGYDIRPTRTSVAWDHSIEVELLAETTNIVPGQTTTVGLRLDPAEHWHTYWRMGGDSGEPTSVNDWTAPEGTTIGEIQWPAPHWLPFYDTDLVNFGYEAEVLLPIDITLPADFEGDSVELSTLAFWNVCDQVCIPGEQRLSVTLPVAEVAELDATKEQIFASAREQLPESNHSINSIIAIAGERVSLGFESADGVFADYSEAYFFPEQRRVIKPGPLRDVSIQANLLQITHQQPRRMLENPELFGVLVLENEQGDREAFEFRDPAADASSTTIMPLAAAGSGNGSGGEGTTGLLGYMLFAMLGGLILNLMPCVFPVLSLKAMSFANSAGESRSHLRMDGLVYTAGVVLAFVALASVLIALRAGGERIGWGFQLQQPWFLAFIVYLFFMMALSMSGVFEIGTGMMGAGGDLTQRKGYQGSFFTGVFATVVATPCTAPFMGPALGFALSQPWIAAMMVFISLGVGMALPILVLSFVPAFANMMPRPGAWMVTFKELMAFPLYAAAIYFLFALGMQVGVIGMSVVLIACVIMAFGVWLYQKRFTVGPVWRLTNAGIAMACFVFAVYVMQSSYLEPVAASNVAAVDADGQAIPQDYEVFSAQRLSELQAQGKPVFINMTAAWCITCLANEQTTLSTDTVKDSINANNITYLKGDWTNEDPEITEMLERFNRPSVPLYVLYSGDPNDEPVILPQILTPGIVADAFSSI